MDFIKTLSSFNTLLYNREKILRNLLVHALVAQAFIPNPENKRQVNHIDGDKTNNHVWNLEWTTPSENIQHAIGMGLIKSGCDRDDASLTAEQVREIRRDCIPNDRKWGFTAFAKKFNASDAVVRLAYYGKSYQNVD